MGSTFATPPFSGSHPKDSFVDANSRVSLLPSELGRSCAGRGGFSIERSDMLNVFDRQSRETTPAIVSDSPLMLHTCTDIALHVMYMLARKTRALGAEAT